MNRETRERIRRAVAEIAAPYTHRNHRRQVAAFLHELAEEYQPTRNTWKGGPQGDGIYWNGRSLYVGRALYAAMGQPRRVHIDVAGTTTRIVADPDGDRLVSGGYGSRVAMISCRRIWHIAQWAEGWRPGRVEGNAIVFDIEAEREDVM